MKRLLFFTLLFLILSSYSVLGAVYADVEIKLSNDGSIDIDGLTNYDGFLDYENSDFLKKQGKYWLLNISSEEIFSDAIFKIILPKDVIVNYLKVPSLLTIDNKDGQMTILATAHEEKLNIQVQFLSERQSNSLWIFILLIFFGIFLLLIAYHISKPEKNSYVYKGLTPRQKQIVDILIKNHFEIIQGEIEKITKLPKSSISRNVDSLVKKGLIHKEQSGMSNKLFLKK